MLDSSTATLRSTSATHDTLNAVMGTSKQLITALEKSDWLDRLLIIAGVVFFFLVVLFILTQRLVGRGIRIAFWWTRFLPTGDLDFEKMERGERVLGTATVVASSAISSMLARLSQTTSLAVASSSSGIPEAEDPSMALSATLSSVIPITEPSRTSEPIDPSSSVHNEL